MFTNLNDQETRSQEYKFTEANRMMCVDRPAQRWGGFGLGTFRKFGKFLPEAAASVCLMVSRALISSLE
jgi:hypothetical protein